VCFECSSNNTVACGAAATVLVDGAIDILDLGDDAVAGRAAASVLVDGAGGDSDVFNGDGGERIHL